MKNKKKIFLILTFLLIVTLFVFKIIWNNNDGVIIDNNAKDYSVEIELPQAYDESKILVPGFSDINVDKTYKEKGMQLFNPEKNDVYFKYELTLKETNEVIYTTNLIPPGKSVEVFPWKNITKGDYHLIINIKTYSIENPKEQLNGANVVIKMSVF